MLARAQGAVWVCVDRDEHDIAHALDFDVDDRERVEEGAEEDLELTNEVAYAQTTGQSLELSVRILRGFDSRRLRPY